MSELSPTEQQTFNYRPAIAIRLPHTSVDYLISLALVDDTTPGDQVRRAIDEYLEEGELPGDVDGIPREGEIEKTDRTVMVRLTAEQIGKISLAAAKYPKTRLNYTRAGVQRYIERRLNSPELDEQIEQCRARYRKMQSEEAADE